MNKIRVGKKGSTVIAAALILSILSGIGLSGAFKSSANSYKETAVDRLIAKRNEVHASLRMNELASDNETVRAIITLKANSVADTNDVSEYTSKLQSKENKIIDNQESLIKKVEKITGNKVVNQSAYLVNSFSIDATRKQMRKIAKLQGVETVYEASLYKTCMNTAVKEGNVEAQWNDANYGYTGEGVVVAVLDTGVNYKHSDMVLDDDVENKYTEEEWKEKIELLGHGNYFTEKVPFGYNYCTGKDDCLSTMEYHGYHVSGIIAGNNAEINGVAKNAQVIGMKVLSDQGGGTTDDIVKGIEDAVKLGADIINMSLGIDNAVVSDEDFMQVALNNAAKEGVICCIAAGNSGTSAGDGDDTNKLNVEDTSILGTPAITKSCLAVASVDNIGFKNSITVKANVGKTQLTFNAIDPVGYGFNITDAKLVDVGVGVNENGKLTVSASKIKNKIAVVSSGTSTINEKMYSLSKAGVKGIIYVNNEDDKEKNISVYDWMKVPVLIVDDVEGAMILSNKNAKFTTVEVTDNGAVGEDVNMSYFSSWGPSNELDIKPEIAAPGGNIKAAYDGTDNYAVLSGTSMATPFAAGSQAIMLNAVRERGLALEGEALTKFLKNSLMNTADPIVDNKTGYYYSVRQQGSGLVDVFGAVDNNVTVTYNNEAKVELGEITGTKDIELTFTNAGAEDATYTVDTTQVYTDFTVNDDNLEDKIDTEEYGIKPVDNSVITFDKNTITVPAGESVVVQARVAISKEFENNKYVESFIKFNGQDVQDIGLPVLGFYGDFDAEPIIDNSVYDEEESFLSGKVEKISETTALSEYSEGECGSILGSVLTKEKAAADDASDLTKNISRKDALRVARTIGKQSINDGKKPDIKKAIPVKVGETVDIPFVNKDSVVIYELTADKKTGCFINANEDMYPFITVYDKDLNIVDTNVIGYMFGVNYPVEISINKGSKCYVEFLSGAQVIGNCKTSFEATEYVEEKDVDKLFANVEAEMGAEVKPEEIKLNKKNKIKVVDDSYAATYTAKEDGYITLDFDTDKFITIDMYSLEGEGMFPNVIQHLEDVNKDKFSKEIKVKAGITYYLDITCSYTDEESEENVVGTYIVKKSDGSNYYTLKTEYDGTKVAFSPNEDETRDKVAPVVTQLRNAKEVKVTVLDENKNVIRTLGNVLDTRKFPYVLVSNGLAIDGLPNYGTGEYVHWDGKVYNAKTGEYDVAKEGQYYIQIESKRTKDSLPQVVTMPVKIDVTEPELKNIEMTTQDENTILTFEVKDNNAMSPYYYLDICGESAFENLAKTYVESKIVGEGKYEINLGKVTGEDTITLMVEDEAGNQTVETIVEAEFTDEEDEDWDDSLIDEELTDEDFLDEEFEDEDYDVDMEDFETEYFELCEGVTVDKDFTDEELILGASDGTILLEGTIESGYELTINGQEVDVYEDEESNVNAYEAWIDTKIGVGSADLNFVVKKDGEEVFNETFTVAVDTEAPYIEVKNNKAFTKVLKVPSLKETFIMLDKDVTFPLSFQVELIDAHVVEESLEVCESESFEMSFDLFGGLSKNKVLNKELDEELDGEVDEELDGEVEGELDEELEEESRVHAEYNGNNIYTITVDSFDEDQTSMILELNGHDTSYNYGGGIVNLYRADAVEEYELDYLMVALTVNLDVEEMLITKDMLNADGTYTITGSVGSIPEELIINDKKIYVDPKKMTFEYNLPMSYGANKIYLDMVAFNGEKLSTSAELYMDEVNVNITNLPKADKNGEINVTNEIFNLKGNITSYVNVAMIDINGDTLYLAPDMATASKGSVLTKAFDYKVKLQKGKNIITFETITMAGTKEVKTLVVNLK